MNTGRDLHGALVRLALGVYLAVHFAQLLPWAGEVFSAQGMLAVDASPFHGRLFNPLFWFDSATAAAVLVGVGFAASLALAAGRADRIAAAVAWLVWMWLYTRNPLIANPSLPFVGWMLLAHATLGRVPRGPAWILMAVAYTYSGITKLTSPSWLDGSALTAVLHNPLARPGPLRDWMLMLPEPVMTAMGHGCLALEVLFLPLSVSPRTRLPVWSAMLCMHLSILLLVDFADLTLGMLLVHAATFDPRWRSMLPSRGWGKSVATGSSKNSPRDFSAHAGAVD